jgi:hypothetical protein
MITCKICNTEMEEHESNNPQPLLPNFEDRVCRDCNDYVTASRIVLREADNETLEHICNVVVGIMGYATAFKRSREMYLKQMEESQ